MKVAIIGVGQTSYGEHKKKSIDELVFESTQKALYDSGLQRDEIESVVTTGSDGLDGRAISNMITAGSSGAYLKDEVKVSDGGIYGLVMGYLRVASGLFDNSLIVSWTKSTESSPELVSNMAYDPFFLRDCGFNSVTSLAIEASAYVNIAKVKENDAADVVLKNRRNATRNHLSHLSGSPSKRAIISSNFVSYPIRKGHLPPKSDGACALVMASEKKAKSLDKYPAWILGLGWSRGEYEAGGGDSNKLFSLGKSSKMAYKMAKIKNPVDEIDVAEVSDITAYHEMMIYEALGFCGYGEGKELINDGVTKFGGKLPVNPSGGILSSNPIFASSLVRVAEAALQVMGHAGKRQVNNAEVALAHGFTAMSTQGSCVVILGN
ncbi:thiolase family protein [Desulfobacterota bacterium AH_259_B03_O07]|nr:thiolase family protein [Desulfobacterota bacterium AH_259_B03_O07]